MKTLVIVGNDKLGRKFIKSINSEKFEIILDESSSIKRVFKLIQRGSLKFPLIFKMFLSDFFRKDYPLSKEYKSIKNNSDLINIIKDGCIKQIVVYRGGLIVSKKVIGLGVKILNIHCAKIPEYGGIGVLNRALKDKAYEQEATLHIITEGIDEGEVVIVEPYKLEESLSYMENENAAYEAGIKLFNKYFV